MIVSAKGHVQLDKVIYTAKYSEKVLLNKSMKVFSDCSQECLMEVLTNGPGLLKALFEFNYVFFKRPLFLILSKRACATTWCDCFLHNIAKGLWTPGHAPK